MTERITGAGVDGGECFDIFPVIVPDDIAGKAYPTWFRREYALIERIATLENAIRSSIPLMDQVPSYLLEADYYDMERGYIQNAHDLGKDQTRG